jgi:hypothetical protein
LIWRKNCQNTSTGGLCEFSRSSFHHYLHGKGQNLAPYEKKIVSTGPMCYHPHRGRRRTIEK